MRALTKSKSHPRRSVALTGFGPFPGVADNASAALAHALARAARRAFPDVRFVARTLPTEWRRATAAASRLMAREQPVLIVHFGVAKSARGFVIERQASNVCRPLEDAAGLLPPAPHCCADGPAVRKATLPIADLFAALKAASQPVALSNDAGAYLCNALLYQSLAEAETLAHPPAIGFIHIPVDLTGPPLTLEVAVAAGLNVLACCLGQDVCRAPQAHPSRGARLA